MPGNDIVDLQWAKKLAHHSVSRWLNKVFIEEEIHIIESSDNPFAIKWLLWTLKESVFKYVERLNYKYRFSPHNFVCKINDIHSMKAIVNHFEKSYPVHFKIDIAYIYSSLTDKETGNWLEAIIKLPAADYPTQRESVREELFRHYSRETNTPVKNLKIIKDKNRIPNLYDELHQSTFPISLSHHGCYAAYVLKIG